MTGPTVEPAVIELGEVRGEPAAEPGGRHPRRHRALLATVAVALTVLGLGGSAAVAGSAYVGSVPLNLGQAMEVDGDRLYVVDRQQVQAAGGGRRVLAYRLPDGARLWDVVVPFSGGEFGTLLTVRGVLLTARYDVDGGNEIIALDAATGAPRWRRSGWPLGVGDRSSGLMLVGDDNGLPGSSGALNLVAAVRTETGEVAWEYRPPPGAIVRTGWDGTVDGATHLVTGLPSGRVEVRDPADARLVAVVVADPGPPVPPEARDQLPDWLFVVGDLLMVQGPRRGSFTAYGLPDLGRRWSTTVEDGRVAWYAGQSCGDVLCLQLGSQEVRALDRRTGRTRWTAGWAYLERVGPLLLASRADGPYGRATDLWLVDPATGRSVRELGRWGIVGRRAVGGDVVVVSQDLLARRTWFGVVDPATRDVHVVGVANGVIGECRLGRDSLLCRRTDLSVGIWRYR